MLFGNNGMEDAKEETILFAVPPPYLAMGFSSSVKYVIVPVVSLFLLPLIFNLRIVAANFIYSFCYNTVNYTTGSVFEANLQRLLLRSLYNKGEASIFSTLTQGEAGPNQVNGYYLCKPDVPFNICQECIDQSSVQILKECPFSKEAIIWYDDCLIRYSNRSLIGKMETQPALWLINSQNISGDDTSMFDKSVDQMWIDLIDTVRTDTSPRMYATTNVTLTRFTTLYGMVQCTPDLSYIDCRTCLRSCTSYILNLTSRGSRVFAPSCNIRYELYSFFISSPPPPQSAPPSNTSGQSPLDDGNKNLTPGNGISKRRTITIVSIVLAVFFGMMATLIGYLYTLKRIGQGEKENNQELELLGLEREHHMESQEFPSVKLDLIISATQGFLEVNKLGEGGFGPVYKGTLADGKEVAVKRLSRSSGQGLEEFKNEISLIARLQHRNLVRLWGCCLERNESILIYEYMPNKSLDFLIFDSTRATQLDWSRRFNIIDGIARGLLYLHEDSRLRIIHRDLKASNILLDHEMNPKISDFGMARIFGINQSEANTNRVVGTYGYMAPEYALEGLFSVKSDVFSFGVLLLEIISGKRNWRFGHSEPGKSLLIFAWEEWRNDNGLELMDRCLVETCVVSEVLKCIHIGLLCVQEDPLDRPTMSNVVLMLRSDTMTLPQPGQPAFSLQRRVPIPMSSSSQERKAFSSNEITVSNISPR